MALDFTDLFGQDAGTLGGSFERCRTDGAQDQETSAPSLIEYAQALNPLFETPPHVLDLIQKLDDVEHGRTDRLMVVWPPQHGKTTLVSHTWPAYLIGKYPDRNIIHGAYNARRARSYGRTVRNYVQSELHRAMFPTSVIDQTTKAKDEMATTMNGHYLAVGIGTGVTGWGAEGIIIDDPVKGMKDAKSPVMQENTWEWYITDLITRLRPNGWIVLIQTRWVDDDLAGLLLKEQDAGGDQWTMHHRPAIQADGTALWEEKRSIEFLLRKKRLMRRQFEALYQGQPASDEGKMFKRRRFFYGTPPDRRMMQVWGTTDWATSEDSGDYTVHVVWGLDPLERLWALEVWREQASSADGIDAFVYLSKKWRPTNWLGERGALERSIGPPLQRELRRQGVNQPHELLSSDADKELKAAGASAWHDQHGLWLPLAAAWSAMFVKELTRFPVFSHDDQVDNYALIGRALNVMKEGQLLPSPQRPFRVNIRKPTIREVIEEGRRREEEFDGAW